MRRKALPPTLIVLAAITILSMSPSVVVAANGLLPRERHPWGRFAIGSWKQVRVLSETLDEKGRVTGASTTETLTTLVDVDDRGYTLHIEVTLEVAGKRFTATPQIIKQGFSGESEGQTVASKIIGEGNVIIDGQKIPCEIRQMTINGGTTKRVITVHFSNQFAPFVLQRRTTSTDLEKNATNYQTDVEVIALGMPYQVLAEMKTTSTMKTIHRQSGGSRITLEVHCDDVPGGVVSHTSKEISVAGKVIRHSTLELVDYGIGEEQDGRGSRRRMFQRNQRRQKTPPR